MLLCCRQIWYAVVRMSTLWLMWKHSIHLFIRSHLLGRTLITRWIQETLIFIHFEIFDTLSTVRVSQRNWQLYYTVPCNYFLWTSNGGEVMWGWRKPYKIIMTDGMISQSYCFAPFCTYHCSIYILMYFSVHVFIIHVSWLIKWTVQNNMIFNQMCMVVQQTHLYKHV